IAVIRGRHRFRVLAKAEKSFDLSGYLRGWLRRAPKAEAGGRLEGDIDPASFLWGGAVGAFPIARPRPPVPPGPPPWAARHHARPRLSFPPLARSRDFSVFSPP